MCSQSLYYSTMHIFKNLEFKFFECAGGTVLLVLEFSITVIKHTLYNGNYFCFGLRGKAHATPIIIVISFVWVCRGEAHSTPSIIIISFLGGLRG